MISINIEWKHFSLTYSYVNNILALWFFQYFITFLLYSLREWRMTTLPHICQNCIIHPLYIISYFAGLCLLKKLLHSSSVYPIWFINIKQNVIRLPHHSEIMFSYISASFISTKWKLTWQPSFRHVKKCLSYLDVLLFYALAYYICKALFVSLFCMNPSLCKCD